MRPEFLIILPCLQLQRGGVAGFRQVVRHFCDQPRRCVDFGFPANVSHGHFGEYLGVANGLGDGEVGGAALDALPFGLGSFQCFFFAGIGVAQLLGVFGVVYRDSFAGGVGGVIP